MGTQKDELIDTEERWLAKCEIEVWKCSRCGGEIPHGEQEIFFRTGKGMCGLCARVTGKDKTLI